MKARVGLRDAQPIPPPQTTELRASAVIELVVHSPFPQLSTRSESGRPVGADDGITARSSSVTQLNTGRDAIGITRNGAASGGATEGKRRNMLDSADGVTVDLRLQVLASGLQFGDFAEQFQFFRAFGHAGHAPARRGDAPRRAVQPPCVADGRAAELINDTSQENSSFPAAFYAAATRAATK